MLVLGQELWQRRFNGDRTMIGTSLDLNYRNLSRVGPTRFTVLGVATASVQFPPLTEDFNLGRASVAEKVDVLVPQFVSPDFSRSARELDVVGKLRPGVSIAQAKLEMELIAGRQ